MALGDHLVTSSRPFGDHSVITTTAVANIDGDMHFISLSPPQSLNPDCDNLHEPGPTLKSGPDWISDRDQSSIHIAGSLKSIWLWSDKETTDYVFDFFSSE